MTMFHDTFCIPSNYDKLIQDQSMDANNLRLDTQLGPIYAQPRSSQSSISTTSATSTSSSNDDLTKIDDQKLVLWIQHQLQYYITLSLLPRLSGIDDIGHGKLLLCLIHRFAPEYLPSLVTLLEHKTSIECLLLADELAQRLWNTAIDSLACYLYYQHITISNKDNNSNNGSTTIGDFVDQLIVPSVYHIIPPSPENHQHQQLSDSTEEGDYYAHRPAVVINTTDLPVCQHVINYHNTKPITACLPGHWVAETHQLIQHYRQHSHTNHLLSLLTLIQQLQQIYVEFTQLTTNAHAAATDDDNFSSPDLYTAHEKVFILPARKLLERLQVVGGRFATVTTTTAKDYTTIDDNDNLAYLVDLLIQQHTYLSSAIQAALCLYQQCHQVQYWISEQQKALKQVMVVDDDGDQVNGRQQQLIRWTDTVLHYRQNNADVLALEEHRRSSVSDGLLLVISTLNRLDALESDSKRASHQLACQQHLIHWKSTYASASCLLLKLEESADSLSLQSKSDRQVSPATLLQQWKILSRRMHVFRDGDDRHGYMAVICLYHQLQSHCVHMDSVESDLATFTQRWYHLEHCLETTRQTIHQQCQVQDLLQQCAMVQTKAIDLEKQMTGMVDTLGLEWLASGVQDLDDGISRIHASATLIMTTGSFNKIEKMAELQEWCDTLGQCKVSYHLAWDQCRSKYALARRKQSLDHIMYQVNIHLEAIENTADLFDPWTCSLYDQRQLDRMLSLQKRRYGQIVADFDAWLVENGSEQDQAVISGIDRMQQLLSINDSRLDILGLRLDWDQKWANAALLVEKVSDSVYGLINKGSTSDYQDVLSGKMVENYKHSVVLVQLAFDRLVDCHSVIGQVRQRQYLLDEQVAKLDNLLVEVRSVIKQQMMVDAYLYLVGDIHQSSQAVGARLDTALSLPDHHGFTDDDVLEALCRLQSSAIHVWQQSGSQIIYSFSHLVVDDMVRWRVVVAFDNLLATLVYRMECVHACQARRTWEEQWKHDIGLLQQWRHNLRTRMQTDDDGGEIIKDVADYGGNQLCHLKQLFDTTRRLYPRNFKIPTILAEQQQRLEVDVYNQVKGLCDLINYLQTSRQLDIKCNQMKMMLNEQGGDASEEMVQQWIDDVKIHLCQSLLDPLHDQQVRLCSGAAINETGSNGQIWNSNSIRMAWDKAQHQVDSLQQRLLDTLASSRQNRLALTYHKRATVLEAAIQCVQDQLTDAVNTHGTIVSGASPLDYQAQEQALQLNLQDSKQALHSIGYDDIRSLLCQQDIDVMARQAELVSRWQSVWQQHDQLDSLVMNFARWRQLLALLDGVEITLAPVADCIDTCTMTVKGDLDTSTFDMVLNTCQVVQATLSTIGQSIPHGDDHNRSVFLDRFDSLVNLVDGLVEILLRYIRDKADLITNSILDRMASLYAMGWCEEDMKHSLSQSIRLKSVMEPLLALYGGKNENLLVACQQSIHHLAKAVEAEHYYSDAILVKAAECEHDATVLLVEIKDHYTELVGFTPGIDWRLDLGVWQYRINKFEQTEIQDFHHKAQHSWLLFMEPDLGEANLSRLKALEHHIQQKIQVWVQTVDTEWQGIKTLWARMVSQVTQAQLEELAWQQWQAFSGLVNDACTRAVILVAVQRKEELVMVEHALSLLEHEIQPILKATTLRGTLASLVDSSSSSTWIDYQDIDNAVDKWKTLICDLRHYLGRLHQYQLACSEINSYLDAMEHNIDKHMTAELETRHKIYSDALDISLEKARQQSLEVDMLMARRNRLEQRLRQRIYHPRTRKISLPAQPFSTVATRSIRQRRPPNAYVADPSNDLDMEIGRIVNKVPYKVELEMMPGEAGRYRFGNKIVYCRILKSRLVMVRVGGGWTELSQFLREHALLVGTVMRKPSLDSSQEAFLETKRCPTRPLSRSNSTVSVTGNAGYKDGDRYFAVDLLGHQHEMKMTPHDSITNRRRL
ncbi:hypothetical protein BC941DRAFT_413416 [Chlamydoabsidia padenii]|nr:hypothetical protein BC941DRAFT_413416 [Chlamydoabsidia padenii]